MKNSRFATLLLSPAAIAFPAGEAAAQDPQAIPASLETVQDLSQLSIEELARLPVRSASKREEPLSRAPTALYVITADDIAAFGAPPR